MYFIFNILSSLESVVGMSFLRKIRFQLFTDYERLQFDGASNESKIFRMNQNEISELYKSINRLREINSRLIENIKMFDTESEDEVFSMNFLLFIHEQITMISKIRKEAQNYQVFEYEFYKFCELFYHTLYYIAQNETNTKYVFLQFAKNTILRYIEKIQKKLGNSQIFHFYDRLERKFQIEKMNDESRFSSLLDFLEHFLASQKTIFTKKQFLQNYNINDLLSLCLNIFVRYYMCNSDTINEFYKNFISNKFLISDQFLYVLFLNGKITNFTLNGRFHLNKFLSEHNLNYEKELIDNGIIPCLCDKINYQSSTLGLPDIGCMQLINVNE